MYPKMCRRTFFALVIRILGVTLMIEGFGIFIMSGFEPLFMVMAIFLFLSGQMGFLLPNTPSWHFVFDMYDLKKNEKKMRKKFIETKFETIIPKKLVKEQKSKISRKKITRKTV